MHGMLFTKIQLDDFPMVFERFLERLEEDTHEDNDNGTSRRQIKETEWILMANVNIAALMQYGSDESLLKKALAEESASRKTQKPPATILTSANMASLELEHAPGHIGLASMPGEAEVNLAFPERAQPVDVSTSASQVEPFEFGLTPATFQHICALSFGMVEFCFRHPLRRWAFFKKLNPYITSILTFLCTITRQSTGLATLERAVPWEPMIAFLNSIPPSIEHQAESSQKLTGGTPLPEDWCIRGMEWVGRRVFERGFWKPRPQLGSSDPSPAVPLQHTASETNNEMDVLLSEAELSGVHEDERSVEEYGDRGGFDSLMPVTQRRWRRVAWAGRTLARHVPGLLVGQISSDAFSIEGSLALKVTKWKQQEMEREQAELARRRRDEEARGEWPEDSQPGPDLWEDEDDAIPDDPLLLELRERRRKLRLLVQGQQSSSSPAAKPVRKKGDVLPSSISSIPGFTVLVLDTNVLLSSLEHVACLVESGRWTVVIPLPGMFSPLLCRHTPF